MSSALLARQAYNPETDELDLGELYPALAKYCPILYGGRSIHSHPRQCLFLLLDQREAFYGGAAGGGKSAALLAAALQYVDVPGYRALILRRTYKQLKKGDALIPLSHEWLDPHKRDGVTWNEQDKTWTFPSGATLEFGHTKDENAKHDYQGAAYQFIGFDELTQFPKSIYEYIAFSRQRRRLDMADLGIPIRVRSTANPGGIGHIWVKERFVKPGSPSRPFIPASVYENPGLDAEDYAESLNELDETLRRQLLEGDWDVFLGAAFEITDDHLVDAFPLEDAMERFEAADYGLNGAPWALWAVDYEGNVVAYDMLYEEDLLPSELAPLVLAKRKSGWGYGHRAFVDPSVWHRTGTLNKWGQPAVLADEFGDNGVPITKANNDPRAGLIRVREMLKLDPEHRFPNWHPRAGESGAPRAFFLRGSTEKLVEELRAAPLQPVDKRDAGEIVDPQWESVYGHSVPMTRYALMTRPAPSPRPYVPLDDDRAEWLRKYGAQVEKPKRTPRDYQL